VAGKTGVVTLVKADITDFADGDYATAAQGTLAASAVQPADNISTLTNDAGYITLGEVPADAVTSVAGKTGIVTLVKADITDFSDADYATAAQGTLAASAVQPADNISTLTNDAGYITLGEVPQSFDYTATNYTDLTTTVAPTATENSIAYVYNSQGTVDIDRKIRGIYVYQSSSWVYANQEIQNSTDTNRTTINNFISGIGDTVRTTPLTGLSTASTTLITSSDQILEALGKLQGQITNNALWQPPHTTLSDYTNSNTLIYLGTNVGEVRAYPTAIDSHLAGAIPLHHNGSDYDGSDIQVSLDWSLFNPPGAGQIVRWQLEYYFSGAGDTPYTATPTVQTINVDVTGGTINTQLTTTFSAISGAAGKRVLMVNIKRVGTADTYTSDAILIGITYERV
jgi:hypothetical protein